MADHDEIMELAKEGVLGRKQKRYRELLTGIHSDCATILRAATIMINPLEDIQADQIEVALRSLKRKLAEARTLRGELEKAGIEVW